MPNGRKRRQQERFTFSQSFVSAITLCAEAGDGAISVKWARFDGTVASQSRGTAKAMNYRATSLAIRVNENESRASARPAETARGSDEPTRDGAQGRERASTKSNKESHATDFIAQRYGMAPTISEASSCIKCVTMIKLNTATSASGRRRCYPLQFAPASATAAERRLFLSLELFVQREKANANAGRRTH